MKQSRTYLPLILLLTAIWTAALAWGNAAMQARHIDQLNRLDNQYKSELRDLRTFQQSAAYLHDHYNEVIIRISRQNCGQFMRIFAMSESY